MQRARSRAPAPSAGSPAARSPAKGGDPLAEYGGHDQRKLLAMSEEEWRRFIRALWKARKSGRLAREDDLLEFLLFRGLYASVNVGEMEGLARGAKKWRLAAAMLREIGFEPVAALQWSFLEDRVEAWPPSEEERLLEIYEESDSYDELLLLLLLNYGPCVAVDASDDIDGAIVLARPKPERA